jgi:hypothetical protein
VSAEARYRRPSAKWCTDVAVRLVQIGCRDSDVLVDGERLLEHGDALVLVRAAAILDAYGQRLEAAKS